MDYTGYSEFPFPSSLPENEVPVKNFFLSLSDDEQLRLLNDSSSYKSFHDRVIQYMQSKS